MSGVTNALTHAQRAVFPYHNVFRIAHGLRIWFRGQMDTLDVGTMHPGYFCMAKGPTYGSSNTNMGGTKVERPNANRTAMARRDGV